MFEDIKSDCNACQEKKLIKNFFKPNFVDDLSNFLFDYHLLEEKRNGSCFNAQNANFSWSLAQNDYIFEIKICISFHDVNDSMTCHVNAPALILLNGMDNIKMTSENYY